MEAAKTYTIAMKILQGGYPKSGNFWLYRLLQSIRQRAGIEHRSFIQNHPVHALAKHWELSYPQQADIDMIDILYPKCFFRISSIFRWPVEDEQEYVNQCNHVWTHSNICPTSHRFFPLFGKRIYIIRDPRDVLLSKTRFAFTPYMKKHYPTYHESPEIYIEKELKAVADAWKWHVQEYLRHAAELDIYIIFYERLKENPKEEINRLLNYLEIDLSEKETKQVLEEISLRKMKKKNPGHVKKGMDYGWMKDLTEHQNDRVLHRCYSLLRLLNYPLEREFRLPRFDQESLKKQEEF